jgi:hypothetical protein
LLATEYSRAYGRRNEARNGRGTVLIGVGIWGEFLVVSLSNPSQTLRENIRLRYTVNLSHV